MSRPLSVLSVQSGVMGNRVYGEALRAHFSDSERLTLRAAWVGEGRTVPERVAYRLLDARLPGVTGGRDLRRARNELATALLARGLVGREAARGGEPDVLHVHTQVPALALGGWTRRIPTVLTTDATALNHADVESDPAAVGARAQPRWTHAPSAWLDRRALRQAAAAVFFSEWAACSARERYGLDPARVHVVPPGVPVAQFTPARHEPADGRPVRLLFVGNQLRDKGAPDALAALGDALGRAAELHLVTRDPLGPLPPGVVAHRGVRPYTPVWFALYASADVFVLPTRIDRFGLVFLEAMAAGLPVVATHVNAVPEIVSDGETGLLVSPGDGRALACALEAVVADADLRRRMGAAGRARAAARFERHTQLERLADVFEGVARDGSPRSAR